MKKSELLETIRSIVREEVNHALPQILMEILAEKIVNNSPKATPQASLVANTMPQQNYRKPQVGLESPVKSEVKIPTIFSPSSKFGQILNETVGGIPQDGIDALPSAIDTMNNIPAEVLNENKDVAAVANALTRDYSQMLKAIDVKAKAKRPA